MLKINTIFTGKNLLIVILLAFVILTSVQTAFDSSDFGVNLEAAQKLSNGENIYAPPFVDGLQYFYSVFFAMILIPFSSQLVLTLLCWSLLSYFLLYRSFILAKRHFDFSELTKKQYRIWVFLSAFLAFQFVLYNIFMVQVTLMLLWAILESNQLIDKGKYIYGGALLGFVINVKIMPVLILPYLFYRGYFRALIVAILVFILLLFLPAIFIGTDYNQFLLSEWWKIINPTNKEHLFETGIGTHSVVALLPVYLTETTGDMDIRRNILNLSHQNVELIINLVRLFLFGLSLFYLRSFPFRKEVNKLKSFWELSFFILLIPLLMPHQQKYAFILALPMIMYLLYYFLKVKNAQKNATHYFLLVLFILCMILYSPIYGRDIIGEFLFLVTQHFRILTFATLLLIPISMYCNPKRLD